MTHKSRSEFIKSFFEILEEKKIPYVVLRNYDGLPDRVGNDIDMLVTENELNNYGRLLCSLGLEKGWYLCDKQKRYGFASYIFFNGNKPSQTLKWDVWAPITWKGLTWVDTEFVMNNRILHKNGFYIPPKGVEAATLVLKEILQNGTIREKNYRQIKKFAPEDPESFKMVLTKYFNDKIIDKLLYNSIHGNWNKIRKDHKKTRNNLAFNSLVNEKLLFPLKIFNFFWGHIKEKSSSEVMVFVCLIGPDGSGKTTISSSIRGTAKSIFKKTYYFHGHYGVFPEFKNMMPSNKYKKIGRDIEEKMDKKTPNGIVPHFLVFYYSLEYIIGYYYLKYKNRNKKTFMVFDRYFYDYLIQPGPFKINNIFIRVLLRIVPHPDILLFLKSPPELVYERKPELAVTEIDRQLRICSTISNHFDFSQDIDNTLNLSRVKNDIRDSIYSKTSKKVFKRIN
ncbi:MAG: thymidylate kinase [Methanobacterium sp. Maddingley MBC34]|nr:MAG: thymidylate kinase [Methanobacterium sp. Maddingley MBC34]